MTFDLKGLLTRAATFNKATAVTVVAFVGANIALPVFHVSIGPEWQMLLATGLYALVHGAVVYLTSNRPAPPSPAKAGVYDQ